MTGGCSKGGDAANGRSKSDAEPFSSPGSADQRVEAWTGDEEEAEARKADPRFSLEEEEDTGEEEAKERKDNGDDIEKERRRRREFQASALSFG